MGVFSTRSPHRPNAIGLTLARLDRVTGDTLWLSGADLVDGVCKIGFLILAVFRLCAGCRFRSSWLDLSFSCGMALLARGLVEVRVVILWFWGDESRRKARLLAIDVNADSISAERPCVQTTGIALSSASVCHGYRSHFLTTPPPPPLFL